MLSLSGRELLICKRLLTLTSRATYSTTDKPIPSPENERKSVIPTKKTVRHKDDDAAEFRPSTFRRYPGPLRNLLSKTWLPSGGITSTEDRKDVAHSFLVRAGYIRQAHSGIYHNLKFGTLVQNKISLLLNHFMRAVDASELSLSSITSEALWKQSGRIAKPLEEHDHELLAIKDRKQSGLILSPTHEEEITALVANATKSYKDFPLRLFQISRKYRDELRPRGGLLRTKEFTMKDLYTFDLNETAALNTYQDIRGAYRNFFQTIGVPFLEVGASSGNMGGDLSHEFHYSSAAGEDTLLTCNDCGYAANEEVVETKLRASQTCPQCNRPGMSSHRAIEVGHTFHLGTRYSEPLKANVLVPNVNSQKEPYSSPDLVQQSTTQQIVPLQMGCHGIGVSRLVGAIAAMTADKQGLCWPVTIAPFHAVIICDKPSKEPNDQNDPSIDVYESLRGVFGASFAGIRIPLDQVVDDREKPMAWKLKDADLVGYPIIIVIGRKWRETRQYEIKCRSRPELSRDSAFPEAAVCDILNGLSPPRNEPGWIDWKVTGRQGDDKMLDSEG